MKTADLLLKKNIKPSLSRIMIYDYLKGTKSHPSVDAIYDKIVKKAPTLSKTTVYNTLKIFYESGLLKELTIEGFQSRYDADTSFHGHFFCSGCKKVFDFCINLGSESGLDGFEINQKDVFYTGLCRICHNK